MIDQLDSAPNKVNAILNVRPTKDYLPCTMTELCTVTPMDTKLPLAIPPLITLSTELADKRISLLRTFMSANTLPLRNAVTFTPKIPEFEVSALL